MGHHHRYAVGHAVEARHCCTAVLCINKAGCHTSACTGASRGIGQAIAEQMADEKANLILLAQREGALKEVLIVWALLQKLQQAVLRQCKDAVNLC